MKSGNRKITEQVIPDPLYTTYANPISIYYDPGKPSVGSMVVFPGSGRIVIPLKTERVTLRYR